MTSLWLADVHFKVGEHTLIDKKGSTIHKIKKRLVMDKYPKELWRASTRVYKHSIYSSRSHGLLPATKRKCRAATL